VALRSNTSCIHTDAAAGAGRLPTMVMTSIAFSTTSLLFCAELIGTKPIVSKVAARAVTIVLTVVLGFIGTISAVKTIELKSSSETTVVAFACY
jgi:hypothetical protein